MPFGFPSHQGLIAPLWRRWPNAFDVPAMCVGAGMPDVVDACQIFIRGHFGQSVGHSLAGLAVLGMPLGLGLWALLHAGARRMPPLSNGHFPGRAWNLGLAAFARGVPPSQVLRKGPFLLWSLWIGGFSHLLFDLISHGGFPWLMPWVPKIHIFPEWWYAVWTRVSLPGYESPYEIGPHFLVWMFLSIAGIVMLFYPAFRGTQESK